ncbi:oligosaccharide flippase family protein [Robiginitalea sediminis]|uniref:oligosaccharide flippase family protein n=1 Tax=Robiginitalea sediminis TaxID=1982593 RepID=UPI000B4C1102|nr:polysaccharide biosynthesis C-terminal domain-containing protein [Robiginitalea sediminis]
MQKLRFPKSLVTGQDQKELTRKAGVFIFFRIAALILGYAFTLVVIKYFGSPVYSMVVLGFTIFTVISIVGKLGYDVTLTRYVAEAGSGKELLSGLLSRALLRSLLFSSLIAGVILLFREAIGIHIFKRPQFTEFLFWTALTFPLWSLVFIFNGLFRGLRKNTLFSFYTAFGRFFLSLGLLALAIWLLDDMGETIPILVHFLAIALLLLSCAYFAFRVFGFTLSRVPKDVFRPFALSSRPILYTSIVAILLVWVDRFFVGAYLEESAVAVYDVSAKLALLVSFNLDAINSILAPKIVSLYDKDNLRPLQKLLNYAVGVSSAIAIFTLFVLWAGSDLILGFFGPEYLAGAGVLLLLGTGQAISCICGSVGNILQMTNHQHFHFRIMAVGLVLNLVLNFTLVGRFGIEGVAFATFASLVCWNIMGAYYVKKKLGLTSHLSVRAARSIKQNDDA